MATLPIIQAPDPRLNVVCKPVETFDAALREFALDMQDTRRVNRGVGLAAPQVGEAICVVSLNQSKVLGFSTIVNPVIVKHGNNQSFDIEGCLSIENGQRQIRVKRWDTITVRFQTVYGDEREQIARGYAARVLQHEIDHLCGKLIG